MIEKDLLENVEGYKERGYRRNQLDRVLRIERRGHAYGEHCRHDIFLLLADATAKHDLSRASHIALERTRRRLVAEISIFRHNVLLAKRQSLHVEGAQQRVVRPGALDEANGQDGYVKAKLARRSIDRVALERLQRVHHASRTGLVALLKRRTLDYREKLVAPRLFVHLSVGDHVIAQIIVTLERIEDVVPVKLHIALIRTRD